MIFKKKPKEKAIILIISLFFQLKNFFSFFDKKKLITSRKVFSPIFSYIVSEKLIFHLKEYIENFLLQDNLKIVIGAFSLTLYYSKTIFNINQVYYRDDYKDSNRSLVSSNKYINIYNSLNIKNLLN